MTNDKQRERLVELVGQSSIYNLQAQPLLVEQIADYLLANNVIVKPPQELCECIGGTIFVIADDEVTEVLLTGVYYNYLGKDEISTYDDQMGKVRIYRFADFGKTVFLIKEEAEEALGGVQG